VVRAWNKDISVQVRNNECFCCGWMNELMGTLGGIGDVLYLEPGTGAWLADD